MDYKQAAETIADRIEADPESWCQHTMARNAQGYGVGPDEPGACSWCLVGHARRLRWSGELSEDEYERFRQLLWDLVGDAPTSWNDYPERTPAEVVTVLRRVAADGDPCIVCGAPISADNRGHDPGCTCEG